MATAALLKQLAVWRPELRDLGPLRLLEQDQDEDEQDVEQPYDKRSPLVLRVDGGRLTRAVADATLRAASEALSALTLLARVDIAAWRAEVSAVWPQFDHQQVTDALYRCWRAIVMGLHFEVAEAEALELLRAHMVLEDGFSDAFRALLSAVKICGGALATFGDDARRWTDPIVPVSLTLMQRDKSTLQGDSYEIRIEQSEENGELLEAVVPLVSLQHMNVTHHHRPEKLLKIDTVGLQGEEYVAQAACVAILGGLVEKGIRVRDVPVVTHSGYYGVHKGHLDSLDVAMGMRSLLAVPGAPQSCRQGGVREVTISEPTTREYQSNFLSAVQHSQSVHRVILEGLERSCEADSRSEYWRFVAFALFSPYTTHNITTLELRLAEMRMRDVSAVHEVLSAPNPFAVTEASCNPNTYPRRVQASEFFIGEPTSFQGSPEPVLLRTETSIDVLLMDEEKHHNRWLKAQVPGSGKTWITCDGVDNFEDRQPDSLPESSRVFRKVIVEGMPKESTRAIVTLFRFIGRGIKELEVHGASYDEEDDDDWIRQLFIECPDLEDLKIQSSRIYHLEPLYVCFESGHCRVQRLTIDAAKGMEDDDERVTWQNSERQMWNFFNALSDPAHRMNLHLRELDLDFSISHVWSVFSSLEGVMRENRTLRSLRIHARICGDTPAHIRRSLLSLFPGGFEGQETTHVKVYELSMRAKLAFLSVVHRHADHQIALGRVDIGVVQTIFQFAADCCVRKIRLSIV